MNVTKLPLLMINGHDEEPTLSSRPNSGNFFRHEDHLSNFEKKTFKKEKTVERISMSQSLSIGCLRTLLELFMGHL